MIISCIAWNLEVTRDNETGFIVLGTKKGNFNIPWSNTHLEVNHLDGIWESRDKLLLRSACRMIKRGGSHAWRVG